MEYPYAKEWASHVRRQAWLRFVVIAAITVGPALLFPWDAIEHVRGALGFFWMAGAIVAVMMFLVGAPVAIHTLANAVRETVSSDPG